MLSSELVVQEQLDAYNARDLERYLAVFSDDIKIYKPPVNTPSMMGKKALADFYATERFNRVNLHAELINRMVLGDKVVDHEKVWGVTDYPLEMVAVYSVHNSLINCIWFYMGS